MDPVIRIILRYYIILYIKFQSRFKDKVPSKSKTHDVAFSYVHES